MTCQPELGEGMHGYLRRLAELNGHVSMSTFMGSLRLLGTFGPDSGTPKWERLAFATGLPVERLAPIRWEWVESRSGHGAAPRLLGAPIAAAFASPNAQRFCPVCLARCKIMREFWTLSYVVACPRHGCLLAERCSQCDWAFTGSHTGSPWGCVCGVRFDEEPVVPAPKAALRMARNLAAMVGPDLATGVEGDRRVDLPRPFADLTPHDYLAYVHAIGTAATTPAAEDGPVKGVARSYPSGARRVPMLAATAIAQIEAAHRIMDAWPDAYHVLLADVESRSAGQPGTDEFNGAFSTRIGRSLRHPIRGSDGLPLPLLHQAVDAYWDERHPRKRRSRNLTTSDPTARRVHVSFNAKSLGLAIGDTQGRTFHSRVLRRVLAQLSPDDLRLDDGRLADVVRERAVALALLAKSSLSSLAAKIVLEGGDHGRTLDGWEHLSLMPADLVVQGLRLKNGSMYLLDTVQAVRGRIAAVARKVEDPKDLVPLTAVALTRGAMRPWYTKTDLLLDIFDGRIAVHALVDEPKLCDLLIDHQAVRALSAARNPALLPESPGFVTMKRLNNMLRHRHGQDTELSLDQYRRLARWSLVRTKVRRQAVPSKDRDAATRFYHAEDVASLIARRIGGSVLTAEEAAVFAPIEDIGLLVTRPRTAGLSFRAVAEELSRLGVLTPAGFEWHQSVLRLAVLNMKLTNGQISAMRVARE